MLGGSLSIAQLLLDCSMTGSWDGLKGGAVKIGLGVLTLLFDCAYIAQYWQYRGKEGGEQQAGFAAAVEGGPDSLLSLEEGYVAADSASAFRPSASGGAAASSGAASEYAALLSGDEKGERMAAHPARPATAPADYFRLQQGSSGKRGKG